MSTPAMPDNRADRYLDRLLYAVSGLMAIEAMIILAWGWRGLSYYLFLAALIAGLSGLALLTWRLKIGGEWPDEVIGQPNAAVCSDTPFRITAAIVWFLFFGPAMGVAGMLLFTAIGVAIIHGVNPFEVLRASDTSAYKYTIMIAGSAGGGGLAMLGCAIWMKFIVQSGLISAEFAGKLMSGNYGKW